MMQDQMKVTAESRTIVCLRQASISRSARANLDGNETVRECQIAIDARHKTVHPVNLQISVRFLAYTRGDKRVHPG
jgi:hypothetical protein